MESQTLTVSELTENIKELLEREVGRVSLRGEISNLARPRSGHLYFNIKDEKAQIAGVMFRSAAQRCKFDLEDGLEVLLLGRVTVYGARGVYQVIIDSVEPLGSGALRLAFDQLKEKLSEEGLFDREHKQDIPTLPRGIGIVTSPTGAAVRDILNVLERRFSTIPVFIFPVAVQGNEAASEIANAIRRFQTIDEVDLLIVGRGGGSIEDLWAFNEEEVARAIFDSKIPIISAVGHETDVTISDFVADLRAPTPSAAAELAVPLKEALIRKVEELTGELERQTRRKTRLQRERLEQLHQRLRSPEWIIQGYVQKVDDLIGRAELATRHNLSELKNRWGTLHQRLSFLSPLSDIKSGEREVREKRQRLDAAIRGFIERRRGRFAELSSVLESLSPLSVLRRGYACVTDDASAVVASIENVNVEDRLKITLKDGLLETRVSRVDKKTVGGERRTASP